MKSRTSFFNRTVLRKDITRFAPVWGLYTVFTLMALLLLWNNQNSPARFANSASSIMQSMGILNFGYAFVCAILLFGDLFSSRLCNALHAMPMRREGWFFTHLTAGLLFCLVPNTLAALVCAALLQQYFWMAFLWLGLMVLQFLFFFGVGAFACISAGNRLGVLAVYVILNFFALIALWLAKAFYEPFLYGIEINTEIYARLSPVVQFTASEYVMTHYEKMPETAMIFDGFITGEWVYAFVAAATGLVFLALAVLVYRKRQLEKAGDLISLAPVRPVFLVVYTLCVSAAMYFVGDMASGDYTRYLFLVIGLIIGFFTGRMLLEKKVNVFRGKNFLAFAILLSALGVSLGLTWLDPAGITRYVPAEQSISQVIFSPYSNYHYYSGDSLCLTDPEQIRQFTQLHQDLVTDRTTPEEGTTVYIQYTLKSGRVIERHYAVDIHSENGKKLQEYYSSMDYLLGGIEPDTLLENAMVLEFHSFEGSIPNMAVYKDELTNELSWFEGKFGIGEAYAYLVQDLPGGKDATGLDVPLAQGLFEAMEADCQTGAIVQVWDYHHDQANYGEIVLQYYIPEDGESIHSLDQVRTLSITIFENCENTIAYLKSIGQ